MNKDKELLEFQVVRSITMVYKNCLNLIEGLQQEHDIQFGKLKKSMPEKKELLTQAEYLDRAQFNFLRKKILDSGNDVKRELISYMENFDIKTKE